MPWTDANGVSLRYELSGQGPRTLVLLHEMGGCLESWDGVVPGLAAQFQVLRYDMRGAGLSEKRRTDFSIDDLSDDLLGLLDALQLTGPVGLAGCAVGAATALHTAVRAPARVGAVLAMAPATGLAAEKKAGIFDLAAQFESQGVRERILQRFDHAYPPHYFADPRLRAHVRGRLLSHDPHAYAATYRMLCAMDMEAGLDKILCPVMVIAGRHDSTRPPATVQKVAQRIPGARFRAIDSGHAMPILTPELVTREILDFFDSDAGSVLR
jgi:3-oxoadipate enol-lactonase